MVSTFIDAHPNDVIVLEQHVSDAYTVPFSTERGAFFPGTGIPDFWFDGSINVYPNGSGLNSGYAQAAAVPTDVTIDMMPEYISANTYTINADVCIEPDGTGKSMRIYMAQALDAIFQNPPDPPLPSYARNTTMQGLDVADVTLAAGGCDQVSHTFTFNATSMAHEEDIIVVVWAQEIATTGPADVYQAARMRWPVFAANFSHTPARPAVSQTVQFTDESLTAGVAIDTWAWDFGDGNTSPAQNPTHAFSPAGCYDVTLEITSGAASTQVTKGVPVGLAESVADFDVSDMQPDVNQQVNFTDLSTGDITTRFWDFGDGTTSTQTNPSHTYTTKGDYTVTLTVGNGCDSDAMSMVITVCETVAPVADFVFSPNPAAVGQNLFFLDRSVGDVLSWAWDFGDGATASTKNVVHSYSAPGAYDVSLTVSSGCLEDTFVDTVNVCQDPTAAFSSSPSNPGIGETVYFTDQSTGGAVAWNWDFGDGATSTLQNPTHAYTANGVFTVTLTITETYGCTADTTGTVNVVGEPAIFDDGFESGNTSGWSAAVQ